MIIFPFLKGTIALKTSKSEFISSLKKLTEKDYPLIRPTNVSSDDNLKEYASEFYDDSFMLWKIPAPGLHLEPFIFTTIHGRLIESGSSVSLKYHVRFNLWTNILVAIIIIGTVYLLYDNIFLSDHFNIKSWLIMLISYPLFVWTFRDCAKDDKAFIEKLTA